MKTLLAAMLFATLTTAQALPLEADLDGNASALTPSEFPKSQKRR